MGNLTLILGGARSGKSEHAVRLANELSENVLYIATAQPLDEEMASRIELHKRTRPSNWKTIEIPKHIQRSISKLIESVDVVILDCLTLLVSNILMTIPDHEHPDDDLARELISNDINDLVSYIQSNRASWIIVSNEVGLGLVPAYPLGRVYRDQLGWANKYIADKADEVLLMVAGLPMNVKPINKD